MSKCLGRELVGFVPVENGPLGIALWNKVDTALIKLIFEAKKNKFEIFSKICYYIQRDQLAVSIATLSPPRSHFSLQKPNLRIHPVKILSHTARGCR